MTNEIAPGIKGMTDRPLRPPRIGKVRLGRLVPSRSGGDPHPEATDHFVFDKEFRDDAQRAYGDEPKRLPIIFPADDLAAVAAHNFKLYGGGSRGPDGAMQGGKLKCIGNGTDAKALVKLNEFERWSASRTADDNGELIRAVPPKSVWLSGRDDSASDRKMIPCFGMGVADEPPCPLYGPRGCQPMMHLQFMLPDMPGFGIWQCDTGSEISITNMLGFLGHMVKMTGGRLAGIPLELRLTPEQVAPDGKVKTVYVLELHLAMTTDELREALALEFNQLVLPPPAEADRPLLDEGAKVDDLDRPDPTVLTDGQQAEQTAPGSRTSIERFGELPPDGFSDARDLYQWCWNELGITSAQALERWEVPDISALRDRFDGDLMAAAAELLNLVKGAELMDRMTDGNPPLGDDGPAFSDDGAEQVELVRGS